MVAGVSGEAAPSEYLCAFGKMMRAREQQRPNPDPNPVAFTPLSPARRWRRALELAVDGKPSCSYISRHLGIDWDEANALLDRMERHGIVSAPDVIGRRTVLTARKLWLVEPD